MYHVPTNQLKSIHFRLIFSQCVRQGMKFGTMLGTGYGLVTGLLFGLPVGFVIGLGAGFVGGLILAICIFAWRKWLNPAHFDERYIRWLAPLPLSLVYSFVAYQITNSRQIVNPFESFGSYLVTLITGVTHYNPLNIFVTWPCIIMSITLIIVIPSILHETQPV